jgi:hypothetical protein
VVGTRRWTYKFLSNFAKGRKHMNTIWKMLKVIGIKALNFKGITKIGVNHLS